MRKARVGETVKFIVDAEERSRLESLERLRLATLRKRWLSNMDLYHPEGDNNYFEGDYFEGDIKCRGPNHIDIDRYRDSRSVYSQDDMPWQGPETYSIRNNIYERG